MTFWHRDLFFPLHRYFFERLNGLTSPFTEKLAGLGYRLTLEQGEPDTSAVSQGLQGIIREALAPCHLRIALQTPFETAPQRQHGAFEDPDSLSDYLRSKTLTDASNLARLLLSATYQSQEGLTRLMCTRCGCALSHSRALLGRSSMTLPTRVRLYLCSSCQERLPPFNPNTTIAPRFATDAFLLDFFTPSTGNAWHQNFMEYIEFYHARAQEALVEQAVLDEKHAGEFFSHAPQPPELHPVASTLTHFYEAQIESIDHFLQQQNPQFPLGFCPTATSWAWFRASARHSTSKIHTSKHYLYDFYAKTHPSETQHEGFDGLTYALLLDLSGEPERPTDGVPLTSVQGAANSTILPSPLGGNTNGHGHTTGVQEELLAWLRKAHHLAQKQAPFFLSLLVPYTLTFDRGAFFLAHQCTVDSYQSGSMAGPSFPLPLAPAVFDAHYIYQLHLGPCALMAQILMAYAFFAIPYPLALGSTTNDQEFLTSIHWMEKLSSKPIWKQHASSVYSQHDIQEALNRFLTDLGATCERKSLELGSFGPGFLSLCEHLILHLTLLHHAGHSALTPPISVRI